MNIKTNRAVGTLVAGAALLVGSACADLNVTNPNNPDIKRALASPEDVINIANSTLFNWYRSATYIYPYIPLSVTADVQTANYGNFGMRFNNLEPRIPYENNSASGDASVASSPWNNSYSDLGLGNDVLRAFGSGLSLGSATEDAKYAALAKFTQAASLSALGMLFDQAFVVDENTDLEQPPELKPYPEVLAAAQAKWDELLTDLAGQSASYDTDVLPIMSADGDYSLSAGRNITLTSSVLASSPTRWPRGSLPTRRGTGPRTQPSTGARCSSTPRRASRIRRTASTSVSSRTAATSGTRTSCTTAPRRAGSVSTCG